MPVVPSDAPGPKAKVAHAVIETLRQDIVTGRLAPGARMPSERTLAEQHGTSQPTVREALRALETLGLVEVRHGSGTYVGGHGQLAMASGLLTFLQMENVPLREIASMRGVIGCEVARSAARNATLDQVETIAAAVAALDGFEQVSSNAERINLVLGYHVALSSAADNSLAYSLEVTLAMLMVRLQIETIPSRSREFWRVRIRDLQPLRRAILEAIRARSPEAASDAAGAYYRKTEQFIEADETLRNARMSDARLTEPANEVLREVRKLRKADGRIA
jgi:GntR family transcriptional repressor for pyruvate dehydrogenase complex